MSESQYFAQRDQKNEEKLKAMLSALPSCCTDFFRGIEPSTSSMTRLSYAYDLTMFFHFLKEIKEEWKEIPLEQLQTEALSQISVQDIERYLEDLKYRPNDPEHKNMNREQGIKRKFFSLKSFFGYLCRVGLLTVNPTLSMQMPRTHAKEIVRLNSEEMKELLAECDAVITSGGVSVGQKDYLPAVLEQLNADILFAGVAQKPGSPMLAGKIDGKLVFCLSGNPFAAAATLEQYAVPALLRAAGRCEESCLLPRTTRTLTTGFSKPSKGDRYLRAKAMGGSVTIPGEGNAEAHSSGSLSAMIGCNCLVELPAGSGPVTPGEEVEVLSFVQ